MHQKVTLIGHLGNDPESRFLGDGTQVTNFSLATSERWKGADGEQKERTTWWRVACWRGLAETVNKYLSKGSRVFVEGRMNPDDNGSPRLFERNDGSTGASYELTADTVRFLDRRGEGPAKEQSAEEELADLF